MFSYLLLLALLVFATNSVGCVRSEDVNVNAGTPEELLQDLTCTTLTAQSIRVSWTSAPVSSINITGYKVTFGPSNSWHDDNTKCTIRTASNETILHHLKKYTNYRMQVLAHTSDADIVRSGPIYCQTEQDVPEAPAAIKSLVMSANSIFVSWKPPVEPNGIIEHYTVYVRESGPADNEDNSDATTKIQKVAANLKHQNLNFEAKDLDSKLKYEFWVTASTNIGEGQTSKSVVVAPSSRVPAKIASFDDIFTTTYKEDVTLPCLTVGVPQPEIKWKIKGVALVSNDHNQQQPDGSLLLRDVTRTDAGEYSCNVENSFGQDSVTHQLIVNSLLSSPQVTLTATTTSSLSIKITSNSEDTEPIHGYTVHYKPEFGDWETVQVESETREYTLENLLCGTGYQVYVTAYSSIGTGDSSNRLNARTRGDRPGIPSSEKFIEVSSNHVILHLDAWSDGSCSILFFVIELQKKDKNLTNTDWIQVANNVKPGGRFFLSELEPAVLYDLRVTVHNNAGFTVAEYEFLTSTTMGNNGYTNKARYSWSVFRDPFMD